MSFYKLLLIPFFSIFLSMPWWQEPAKSAKYYEQSKWAELDSLRDIRQSQLLYKKSDAILQKALKENQHAIALKALNYKMMSREFREENAAQKNFEELELLIENSEFPLNQILASMQVELLQNFYSRKKYSIDQRKATSNERDAQLDYWTKNDFQEKMLELQLFAISNAEKLDAEKLNSYKILFHKNQKDSSEYLSKSLYPILFNRALSWFASMDFESTNPKTESAIEQPVLFAPIPEFVKIDISKDSLLTQSTGSIFLFREILHFYNKKEEELVLTHFNIERLKWAHSVSTLNNKDSLLLKSYAQFRNTLTTDAARNWVNSERARLFQNLSNNAEWASQEDKVTFRKGALFIASILLAKNDTAFWKNRMQQLKEEILSETFSAELPEHSFPGSPNLVQVNYKNKKQVYWQLIKFNSWSDELRWHNTKEAFSELKKGKVLHNGRFDLKGSEDYFPHSMEFKLPALEAGNYILLLSDSAEFTDTSQLHLKHFNTSNLTVVHRKNSENGALEWVVRDAKSGAALKGAELQLYFKSYDYQSRKSIYKTGPKLKSNSKGLCSWMSGDKYRGSIYIDVSYNDEKLEKLGSFYSSPPQKPTDRPAINFFSDRSIYRPGQTLHFKAIAVQPNGNERSLKSNWTQEFQLLDANYQEIDKKSLKSDDYGAFNASFQLPESGLNGNYRIKTNYGTYTFKVEAYERPKFEIELLPLEGFVKIGDSIKIKGNAASFAGVALQNADLKYRVELLPQYRPYYQRGGWYPGIKGKEISFGALKVDDKGNFEFSFLAKKGKQEDFQNYKVEVSATDITGETQKSEKIYRIDKAPFQIKAAIPQYIYDRENAKWNIRAVNSSEATVPAAGKIKVYKLQSPEKPILARSNEPAEFSSISEAEFKKNWPYLAFKEEHKKENWPQGELVYEAGIKDDTVLTPDFLQHAEAGAYKAEITLWGGSSQPIQQEQYFSLFDLEKLKMPAAEAAFFHISESSAKVGESLELFIGSGFKNAEFEVLTAYKDGEESNRHTISNELKQISIPIHKSYEGNFTVEVNMVKFGRSFSFNKNITVPYENSKLKLELESKRSTLTPGSEEEWTIRIKDEKGKPVVASLLAAMYDASLDQIYAHSWSFNPMPVFSFNQYSWSGIMGQKRNNLLTLMRNDAEVPFPNLQQPQIPDFESIFSRYYGLRYRGARSEALSVDSDNEMAEAMEDESAGGKSDKVGLANYAEDVEKAIEKTQEQPEEKVRSNFAETAFFFAHIESNESGESVFKFTLPDAITRWKMQALAHSKSLQYGLLTESFEARKELMIEAQPQRFLRQGDSILFHAKISNLSDKAINVSAMLQWLNPYSKTELTPQFIDKSEMKIQLSPNEVKSISWPVKVPADFDQPLMYRLKAKSESFTDGEEKMLPVLKNNIALSKSRAFQIDENQDKIFDLEKLKQLPEKAQIRAIELEINPNPHWYIIQALPYLTASNYKSSNTLFNQFYAQSISASLANRSPDIRLLFQQWGDALKAPLQRGEAFAISELNNTPWLRDALKDEQRMKNISQLFDVNMLNYEMEQSLKELLEMQSPNGGWPWIKSMPDSRFITQKIVLGFARLQDKELINTATLKNLNTALQKAVQYLDERNLEEYNKIMEMEERLRKKQQIGALDIQYLLLRSAFPQIPLQGDKKKAHDYFREQAAEYWNNFSLMLQAQIALVMHRNEKAKNADLILEALRQNSIIDAELGRYWKNESSPYWYHSPIETHVAILEAFYEIDGKTPMIAELQKWLLNEKRTTHWGNASATADACYAFLLDSEQSWIQENKTEVRLNGKLLSPNKKSNDGSGTLTYLWRGEGEIKDLKGEIKITNGQKNLVWGAVKVHFDSPLEAVRSHGEDLSIKKEIFVQSSSSSKEKLKSIAEKNPLVGEELWVRLSVEAKRNFDFVHLKDLRAAGTETANTLSGNQWKSGLYYYQQADDEAMHFFIPKLQKGRYVLEYPLYVSGSGRFSSGPAQIQCTYATEFEAYSDGLIFRSGK